MKEPIYITSNGRLKREKNTLCFIPQEGDKKYLPVTRINSIHLFSEMNINKRLLEFLSSNEITLHLYNYYGYYVGSFYPREHYNSGHVTLRQAEHYLDHEKRLGLARLFVEGCLHNITRILKYYKSRGRELTESIETIQQTTQRLTKAETPDQLRAIEGNARKTYYQGFNKILNQENLIFKKRTRRPPTTKINSLISFGNSLLYTAVLSEIYKTHLDPRIGYLHETNQRRFSLNLDIAEIFKPIIVDRVIFSTLNRGQIKDQHFMKEMKGVFLNDKGRKLFLKEFEQKLTTTIKPRRLHKKVSHRRLIRLELYKIQKHILNDKKYKPYKARW